MNKKNHLMKSIDKIRSLEILLKKSEEIKIENHNEPEFKAWKNLVERTFSKVFDETSFEIQELKNLKFFYQPSISFGGQDLTSEHLKIFRRDCNTLKRLITSYIEELKFEEGIKGNVDSNNIINKIFISHSSKDKDIVEEIIEIIETIGLNSKFIFCSSSEGYGIELGENFLERIKKELDSNTLVVFILSKNFYESPICLCEMGATWVKTNVHIPILLSPFDFTDIKGVIPSTQGFRILDKLKMNSFKEKIENVFSLKPIDNSVWERKRNRILERIERKLA